MRTLLVLLVSSSVLACGAPDSESDVPGTGHRSDPSADAVRVTPRRALLDAEAERVYTLMRDALDSDTGWQQTRYLEFDWVLWQGTPVLSRSYRFAPWHGDFRIETTLDDRRLVALGNWNTPTPPRVWMDGTEVEGDSAMTLRRRAERMFEVDVNQLLLPFRWDDVRLGVEYVGRERDEDGTVVEVVALEELGTVRANEPRQVFHIHAETGIPVRTVRLPGGYSSASATELAWDGWEEHGPLLLSTLRRGEGPGEIRFENITVLTEVPARRFTPPN